MKKIKDSGSEIAHASVETRIFRVMVAAVALAVMIATVAAPWRVSSGLLLGGLLSLLNYRWLRSSVGAIIEANIEAGKSGQSSGGKSARYVLRYLVVTAVVVTAYRLKLVSLPATIFGLCSFVIALFAEAFREFYFAIIHREGLN